MGCFSHLGVAVCILLITITPGAVTQDGDAREPPNIETPKKAKTLYKVVDASFTIACTATGKPKPTYEWRFKDAIVTSQHPPGGNVSFDRTTGLLKVAGLQEAATGHYTCRAINTHATAMAPRINVQMSSLAPTWPDNKDRDVSGGEGDYLAIPCDSILPAHSGPNNFKWYRRSDSENTEVTASDRVFIDEKGTLHFTSLKISDDDRNLPYSCALSNALSGSIVMGSRVNLIISAQGSVGEVSPQLQYRSGVKTGRLMTVTWVRGQPGRLECFFSGNPAPTVTWKRGSQSSNNIVSDANYEVKENGRVLEMKNVTLEDDTTFWCSGANNKGTTVGDIRVNVTSAPVWDQALVSKTVPQVQNVPFHCKAKSMYGEEAPNKPVWFKNGDPMAKKNTSEHTFSPDGRTLTVLSVTKDKSIACYQCVVTNSVGELYGQGCLNVVLPLTIITQPPSEQEITKGDVINFTVVATSDPLYKTLTYEWEFRNKTYTKEDAPPFVLYDIWSRRASLNTSKLTDEQLENITGLYRRFVYHVDPSPYQRRVIDVTVTLKVEPGPAAAGFQYWIIGLILAIIIILLVLIICCCVICRRKMQEGDYPVDRKETAAGLDPEREVKESGFPDLSRAQDPNQPKKPGQFDMDGQSIRDDESFASTEYGGEEFSRFNEDGSFLGAYASKDNKTKQPMENPGFQPAPPPRPNNAYIYDSGNESRV